MVTAAVYAKKMAKWNKIYRIIKAEIREKKLSGTEAAVYWYQRIQEEKLKMYPKPKSIQPASTAGEVIKHERES